MRAATVGDALAAARQRFFARGESPESLVPEVILKSWQRCARLGLDAGSRPRGEPLSAGSLRIARERSAALARLCRPELESLAGDARSTDSIVILTDAEGLVLDSAGSDAFVPQAARVALRPGVSWQESCAGTNAIGTALAERRAVAVRGAEHFFEPHRGISCFCVPILDTRGTTLGALDLSGHASIAHTHALGMVQLAVDQIEHRAFDQLPAGLEVLRLQSDAALLGTAREGVLVFADRKLAGANRHGLALLGRDWTAIGGTDFAQLFDCDAADLEGLARITLRDGRNLHLRGESRRSSPRRAFGPTSRSSAVVPCEAATAPWTDVRLERALDSATAMLDADLGTLLEGETGVGKEVFARQMHARSRWSAGPFVAINCAALPASLIESELFGYESGAFTGARREGTRGLLRRANDGVLLLDEIGDMPLELQSRLLRVLQEREVAALGGGTPERLRFGLISSTHRPLRALVERGEFRADLYYRLAHHAVQLPPLRSRGNLREIAATLWNRLPGPACAPLPEEMLAALARASWPGNFRELTNVLRVLRVHARRDEALSLGMLPHDLESTAARVDAETAAPPEARLGDVAERCMRSALRECDGNYSQAARRLGISRSTLYRRVGAGCRDA